MDVRSFNSQEAGPTTLTPERDLWTAVLIRAVFDACPDMENVNDPDVKSQKRVFRRKAGVWFRDRSTDVGGWLWVADVIGLTDSLFARIEDVVFGKNREDVELVATLHALCKVRFLN